MKPVESEQVIWEIDRHISNIISCDHSFNLLVLEKTLERFNLMAKYIKPWNDLEFDVTNASMYSSLLWILSNEMEQVSVPNRYQYHRYVYMLNRMLHGVDVPPDVMMPDVFYWPHTVGITIARNISLKNYLVMYQGTTIGRVSNKYPQFLGPCIMYPYSSVTGSSCIDKYVVLSTKYTVHDNRALLSLTNNTVKRSDLFEFHFNGDFK